MNSQTLNTRLFGTLEVSLVVSTTGIRTFMITDKDDVLYSPTMFTELARTGGVMMSLFSFSQNKFIDHKVENPERFGDFGWSWITNFYNM